VKGGDEQAAQTAVLDWFRNPDRYPASLRGIADDLLENDVTDGPIAAIELDVEKCTVRAHFHINLLTEEDEQLARYSEDPD
jgi:hypothetical protein